MWRQRRRDGRRHRNVGGAERGCTAEADVHPEAFEQSFAFLLGDLKVRGRIDRIDKHPDGRYEVID